MAARKPKQSRSLQAGELKKVLESGAVVDVELDKPGMRVYRVPGGGALVVVGEAAALWASRDVLAAKLRKLAAEPSVVHVLGKYRFTGDFPEALVGCEVQLARKLGVSVEQLKRELAGSDVAALWRERHGARLLVRPGIFECLVAVVGGRLVQDGGRWKNIHCEETKSWEPQVENPDGSVLPLALDLFDELTEGRTKV